MDVSPVQPSRNVAVKNGRPPSPMVVVFGLPVASSIENDACTSAVTLRVVATELASELA